MSGCLTRMLGRAAAGGSGLASPDANTLFLCRFWNTPPVDDVGGGSGTLVGNSFVTTASHIVTTDGTGDWITFASSSVFDLNTTDFTLEFHGNVPAAQVGGSLSHRPPPTNGSWAIFHNGNGTMDFYADHISGSALINFGTGAANGTMRHYALVRQGSTWKTYVDGVNKATVTNAGGMAAATGAAALYIGTDSFNTTARDISGDFGRVKISNNARWTANFTPPAITDA